MNTLSKRTAALISRGVKTVGSYEEGYFMIEEQLYVNEGREVYEFCKWLDKNHHLASMENPFIESNYPNLFKQYKQQSVAN